MKDVRNTQTLVKMRRAYTVILVGKFERRSLPEVGVNEETILKWVLKGSQCECMDWIKLSRDGVTWWCCEYGSDFWIQYNLCQLLTR
jgi:hypothetical protein